jgi:hypothetical protein
MSDSDNLKSQVRDNWEDDWENDDEIEAKLKANIEETKKKEIQNLVDKAEEELIEDLFLHDTGVNPRKPPSHTFLLAFFKSDLVQDGALREAHVKVDLEKVGVEKNANMKNKEKSYSNKDDSGQKQREQKKEKLAMKKRQEELFGDASLDAIQDQYCDFEDRY